MRLCVLSAMISFKQRKYVYSEESGEEGGAEKGKLPPCPRLIKRRPHLQHVAVKLSNPMREEKSKNCPRENSSGASEMRNNISLVRWLVCRREEEMLCDRDGERSCQKGKVQPCSSSTLSGRLEAKTRLMNSVSLEPYRTDFFIFCLNLDCKQSDH